MMRFIEAVVQCIATCALGCASRASGDGDEHCRESLFMQVAPVTMEVDSLGTEFELEVPAYSVNAIVLTRASGARRPNVNA